ncbi:MAG: hypothetical protein DRQ78_02505 [Epsilonproteobacteria bacterium]|nr:MAG: hypothetical protein DRQ78_02505 [Campylobacterota bacterium]
MKKSIYLSIIAVMLVFTACDEKAKDAVNDAAVAVSDSVKEGTKDAVEATKEAVSDAAEATKEAAKKVGDSVKKSTSEATEAVKSAVSTPAKPAVAAIPSAYMKCKGCHGSKGNAKALGKAKILMGQDKATLIASMNAYKEGTKNEVGSGALMRGQMAPIDDAGIEAIATYLSTVK